MDLGDKTDGTPRRSRAMGYTDAMAMGFAVNRPWG
jgi:hypothetical protein